MALIEKSRRDDAEIPGSSLADIAFLLLIFFLLVTTIDVDTGIGLVLPPAPDENIDPPPIKEKNLLNILVNTEGLVLIDEEPTPIGQVQQKVKDFITNNGADPEMSDSPDKAIVSIKTTRATPYRTYIDMFDEVKGAYLDLRNTAAQSEFGRNYTELEEGSAPQEKIQDDYPEQISIAEPDEGES
jgi:biopolymer transport protein ExbD